MPRNGSYVYSKPAGTTAVPNTTIESAKYNSTIDDIVDDLNAARPVTAGGTGQTSVPAARQAFTTYTTKSAGYTAAKTDAGAIHRCSAEITVALTAATTLDANWTLTVIADGGDVTIDPDGTELINGEATLVVSDGDAAYIICTGSAFVAITIPGVAGVAKLDTVNTFTKTQVWSKGADVASAAVLTLGDDGNYFDVTGTTAITSIATVGVGTVIKLHFDGALTLTHHSTDLVLPGGANITTAAGDEAEFVEYAAGDWRCVNYQSNLPPPILHVRDQKTLGAAGGTSITGTQTRTLNTVVTNGIAGASLSSNQVTLPAGTYDIKARAPVFGSGRAKIYLQESGGGAMLLMGTNQFVNGPSTDGTYVELEGRLTLASSTSFEIKQYIGNGISGNGLGVETNAVFGPEVYAELYARKVG